MSGTSLISLASAGILFLLAWFGVIGTQAWRRRAKVRQRMRPIVGLLTVEATEPTVKSTRKVKTANNEHALIGRLESRYPLAGGARTAAIAVGSGLIALAFLVPVISFFGLSLPLAFFISIVTSVALGWNIGSIRENAKRAEFNDRFLIVLEDFHRMVRFGIAAGQALNSVAAAAAEPVKTSLRNITLEMEFGVPIGTAMEREAHRIRISELAMLAAVVSTQSSTGGSLSESVGNLSATLRERLDNRSRMNAATAESRVTMIILSLVPVAGIALQAMAQPEFLDTLLGEARHLLGYGILLILAGLAISWKLIQNAQR